MNHLFKNLMKTFVGRYQDLARLIFLNITVIIKKIILPLELLKV